MEKERVCGIGIDFVEIERIENSINNSNFLNRWFGTRELAEYESRGGRPNYIAANFCAKEAFAKAIGTGVRGFELREVELLRDPLGKPYLVFSGRAAEIVARLGAGFQTSVSHTKQYAVAVVEAFSITEENDE